MLLGLFNLAAGLSSVDSRRREHLRLSAHTVGEVLPIDMEPVPFKGRVVNQDPEMVRFHAIGQESTRKPPASRTPFSLVLVRHRWVPLV